jgi:glycosyltransferase involved in cell wall biosynthesis
MTCASVSVIVPCFNAEHTIIRALDSVLAQTLPVLEVICVDDASTDNTIRTIESFMARQPNSQIRILRNEKNAGPSTARNCGWQEATGDYIAFLDADDVWHPQKIELQFGWMQNHPTVLACGHRYRIIDLDAAMPKFSTVTTDPVDRFITRDRLLLSNPFVTPSVMLKRDLPYRFDPARRYCEDYFLWLELSCDDVPVAFLDITLVYVYKQIGKSGASRHLLKMRLGDINNYWTLWRRGKLNFFKMGISALFSMLKFMLMLVVGPQVHFEIKQRIDDSGSR